MEHWFTSHGPAATSALGKKIGTHLPAGSILALVGELGCGKTLLTRGICAGLGVPLRQVNSPTFVLVNEYAGRLPVFHLDLYRIVNEVDCVELGLADYLRRAVTGVMIIEWAEKILPLLPTDILRIEFEIPSPRQRRLLLSAPGTRYNDLFKAMVTS
jgi:tRNA threonylcarbamoyladenosine biosynthesis protein TsaE